MLKKQTTWLKTLFWTANKYMKNVFNIISHQTNASDNHQEI